MYCQVCGAQNPDEQEYCSRCHQKLMVVSGVFDPEEQEVYDGNPEEQFSFDEHLLERISILEEVFKRTAEAVRQMLGTIYKLEQKILVNQAGITSLRDLLESKRLIDADEWSELWEARMEHHLLVLEKRERFAEVKDRIEALYQGGSRETFANHLEEAELALLAFDMEAAVRALEEAHQLDPHNHELAFFLGETFFNEGQGESALRYFERVLELKPEHYESLVYGGVLRHERGDNARAEDLLKRAVALYPDSFLAAFSLGAVYASQERLPLAVPLLERAVAREQMPQANYLLGSCYLEMGKTTAAIRQLEEALRLDPGFEEAHYLLGLAYLDRRWYRKAVETLGKVQKLDPEGLGSQELAQFLGARGTKQLAAVGEHGAQRAA
ncbi:MAG: tetratricopeptide repeat protein, partial [Thermoanaerobaculia bacterium]|nr:tetratricopeptide repeat protein [Thermoanaerobaculia bacterium]